ncbi:MAG TPA: hypothetical protein DCF33_03090 [Saprospirales bacterium]|nr:hypothetical protein [Saprospirales bacterium]
MKITLIFSAFLLNVYTSAAQNIDPLWIRQDGMECNSLYGAPFAMVDSAHDIIVCTEDYQPGSLNSILTTKYDPNGQLIWQQKFDKLANDILISSILDKSGAVYVAGNTSLNSTQGQLPSFIVLKYGSDGDSIWQYQLEDPNIGVNYVTKLLLDEDQNLMVFGQYGDVGAQKSGLIVSKLSPNGNVIWSRSYINDTLSIGGLNARNIGDKWVFWGRNFSNNTGHQYISWQLDENGNTINTASSESNFDNLFTSYYPSHIDMDGNLYIGADRLYKIAKYSLDASLQWSYHKADIFPQDPFFVNSRILDIESNNSSEIYVSGVFKDSTGRFSVETLIDNSGQKQWEHNFVFNSNINCGFSKIIKMPNEKMLFLGTISSSEEYEDSEFILSFYDKGGFIKGFISDLIGEQNTPIDAATGSDNSLYLTGISYSESIPSIQTQLLCKYPLDQLLSTTERTLSLNLYPNPVSSELILDLPNPSQNANSTLEIWNTSGQFVKEITISKQHLTVKIPMESLPEGIYHIILRENGIAKGIGRVVKL